MKKILLEAAAYLSINALLPLVFQMLARLAPDIFRNSVAAIMTACVILALNSLRLRRGRWALAMYSITILCNLSVFVLFGMLTYVSFLLVLLR